jgi:ribosomal protein L31
MPPAMRRFFSVPIIGVLVAYVMAFPTYILFSLLTPLYFLLFGFKRIRCGTSIIWTPKSKKQAILDGVELLRACDTQMYLRLTSRQHLTIFYSGKWKTTNAWGRVSGLNERYIQLGSEGVATFFVQSLMLSDACPSINQFKTPPDARAAMRKTLDWMCEHSFRPGLIRSYRKVVERWESSERFRGIEQGSEMMR